MLSSGKDGGRCQDQETPSLGERLSPDKARGADWTTFGRLRGEMAEGTGMQVDILQLTSGNAKYWKRRT
jgi:hypothetical protein